MKKLLIIISIFMTFFISHAQNLNKTVIKRIDIPNFELKNSDGGKTDILKILNNGKPSLIVVAAEWCSKCDAELSQIQKFYENNKDRVNIAVIFTKRKSSTEKMEQYITENGFTFPYYFDSNDAVALKLNLTQIPLNMRMDNYSVIQMNTNILRYTDIVELFKN